MSHKTGEQLNMSKNIITQCQLYQLVFIHLHVYMYLCTLFSISNPTVKVLVKVLIDGGDVGSITGIPALSWNNGGHSERSNGWVYYEGQKVKVQVKGLSTYWTHEQFT